MMKLKKIIAAAASVVMACAFATSAFAASTQEMKDKAIAKYPEYTQIINDLSPEQVQAVQREFGTFDRAVDAANGLQNAVKADPANAADKINGVLNRIGLGITVDNVKVTTNADGSITATATVKNNVTGKSFAVSPVLAAATSEHPEIGEAIKNGTWGVDEKKATAASATVSAPNRVIKATGDNTAVVMLMGALAIVGVLGLAVRKSDAEA